MLHFISWKMYGISLILGLGFFYGYLIYNNKALIKAWLKRMLKIPEPEVANPQAQMATTEKQATAGAASPNEPHPAATIPDVSTTDVAKPLVLFAAIVAPAMAWAQTADGVTGINEANTLVRSYFDPAVNLMYAVGAISGIVGGYQVYQNMRHGRGGAENHVATWFGGCIFLVLVATVLKAFFGI